MCYEWEKSFEDTFKLKNEDTNELKIIIGQEPYKCELNGIKFKVSSSICPYNYLGYSVSFLVTDWIKIQDSLEMVFNLLFKNTVNSIKVLSYLRENKDKITAEQFANYLYRKYSIVLTNNSIDNDSDNIENIKKLIERLDKPTYLLIVGNSASESFDKMDKSKMNIKGYAKFIHPSGQVLGNPCCRERYFNNWYNLKDSSDEQQDVINKFILME